MIVAMSAVCLSSCALHRSEIRRAGEPKREPERETHGITSWFGNQRASAGPVPSRALASALEAAQNEGILTVGPGSWVNQGPRNIGGRITALGVDPNVSNHLWIGTADAGVWDSADGGVTWTPRFDAQTALSIGSIAVHPTDSNTIYVGTGEDNGGGYSYDGEGVFKTTDGGATWTNLGLAEVKRIGNIVIDKNNPTHILVAAGGDWFQKDVNRGVYRSTDGGTTWTKVLYVADDTGAIDLEIDPSNTQRIYAAMWQRFSAGTSWYIGGTNSGIYRSLDGGATWTKLTTGLPTVAMGRNGLAVAPSSPATVYACIISPNGTLQGVYRTINSGDLWAKVSNTNAPLFFSSYSYYFSQIRVDPANANTIWGLDVNLLVSTNGGVNWGVSPGSGSVHADVHDMVVETTGRQLLGTDGGFYKSTNSGSSWTHAGNLPITQFYDLGIDRLNPNRRIAGAQDNNVVRTTTGGLDDWVAVIGGDGLQTEIDYTNSNKVYGESQYGAIERSTDGGSTFVSATNGISSADRTNWNTPITMDPVVPSTLYTGTYRVYRTVDSAQTWTAISPNLTAAPISEGSSNGGTPMSTLSDLRNAYDHLQDLISHTVTVVSVSAVNNSIIWAGTDDGLVWVTSNNGTSWTNVTPSGAQWWVTDIAPDAFDAQTAYLSITGYREGDKAPYLRVTHNLGGTWTDLSGGLPQVPVDSVLSDLTWKGRLFAGTDLGVSVSDDFGASWSDLRGGLPYVVVMDLAEHGPTNTLWAASYARGLYSYDLGQLGPADGDHDGVDNNTDCAPTDGGTFAAPAEVASLSVDKGAGGAANLSWTSLASQAGSSTIYDAATGDLATLAVSGTAAATALQCGIAATAATDAGVLAADTGVYYLVRGRNSCGLGTWGSGTSGPRSLTACP